MKTRNGFVSNSSSSSFVVIAKPNVIEKMLKKEDEITQKVCDEYLGKHNSEPITLDDKEYELYQFIVATEEFGCDCDLDEDEYDQAYDKWSDFINKLEKTKNVIVRSTGC